MNINNDRDAKIYVAGHNGLVGSALLRALGKKGFHNLLYRTSKELDLRDSLAVADFFQFEKPQYVFLAAAKVGGILANSSYPADFIFDNLSIALNVVKAAYESNVEKLLFLGSSCIYPRDCPQPMKEEYLLTGLLEATNEPYAIAKIAGIKLCQSFNRQYNTNFISVMPTNLYGPNDNYDLASSHVLPALIRKFSEAVVNNAKTVEIWGTGYPRREFLHVDDLADACLFLMDIYNESGPINIGTGVDITISELANIVARISGYNGTIIFNSSMPDGTPRKQLDCSKIEQLGWKHSISIEAGISSVYEEYLRGRMLR